MTKEEIMIARAAIIISKERFTARARISDEELARRIIEEAIKPELERDEEKNAA